MTGQESIVIGADDDGQRLDRWLKKKYPSVPFGQMQKVLRTGQLRVDGRRAKGEMRLAAGQVLRVPPLLRAQPEKTADGVFEKDASFIKSLVVYQDADMIVLNKPHGIATQGGSKVRRHIDGMLPALCGGYSDKPRLVHRLDKDTSGLLLLARTVEMARHLGALFKSRDIRKYYWAVTVPAPAEESGRLVARLAKKEGRGGERVVAVDEEDRDGKTAITDYEVVDRVGDKVAWVAFWPRTGRTHQIRVQAAEMGCPLLGDEKYGVGIDERVAPMLENSGRTLHLHAARLVFLHPRTGKKVDISAPLSAEMTETFSRLGFSPSLGKSAFSDLEA